MDAYISEAQVVSGDEVDGLHTEVIPPGHRTICSARVNLEIRDDRQRTINSTREPDDTDKAGWQI